MEEAKSKWTLKKVGNTIGGVIIIVLIIYIAIAYFQQHNAERKEKDASDMALNIAQQQMENDAPIEYRGDITAARGWISNAIQSTYNGNPSYYYEVSFQVSVPIPILGMTVDGTYNIAINISEDLNHYEIVSHGYNLPTSDEIFGDLEQPISGSPTVSQNVENIIDSPIMKEDLIGCWQFRYTEFNTGETISYEDVEDEFLRLYADGSYTYNGHTWGNWSIQGNTAALHDMTEAYKGNPRIIYLKDGTLYLTTSEKTSQFEKMSDLPDYEPYESSQPSTGPSAASFVVPDALYKTLFEKKLFPVRDAYYTEYNEPAQTGMMACDSISPGVGAPWYNTVSFAIIDMDGDGENEVVLYGESEFDGLYTVLHEYEGSVYGYTVNYRGMNPLYVSGLFEGSNGSAESYVSKFEFHGEDAQVWNVAYANWDNSSFYILETPVPEEAYSNYLTEMGCNLGNEAMFYDYTDANLQSLLSP